MINRPDSTRAFSRRSFLGAAAAVCLLLAGGTIASAQGIDAAKAAKLKAAYLLNFVKYTQWPENAFPDASSAIILTLVGQCDVTDLLEDVVSASDPVGGRVVTLRRSALPDPAGGDGQWHAVYESLKTAHLVYVCGLPIDRVRQILDSLAGTDVLTVSDVPAFAANGGMLGFVLRGDRIVFEANVEAIQRSHVSVSAKVLQLAQIVDSGRR